MNNALRRIWRAWVTSDCCLPFPDELRELTCGAKTKAGTLCKRKDLYNSGRCKLHGGLSTGPKSAEGKRKSALNGMKPKKAKSMRAI